LITKTAIFNAALAKVGGYRISDPDEASQGAIVLRDAWERSLKFTLSAHSWDFATKQERLARLDETPAARFRYAYQKPEGWLRSIVLSEYDDMRYPLLQFADQSGRILADAQNVYMEFVQFTEDTHTFSAPFVECLATRLAFEASKAVTTSENLREQLWKFYEESLRAARTHDAIQGPPKPLPLGSWVGAKYGR
jgi:hypothetical protein